MKASENSLSLAALHALAALALLTISIAANAQTGSPVVKPVGTSSGYCQKHFSPDHLGWATTDVPPHQYVMLIAFDSSSPHYHEAVVQHFFHINDDDTSSAGANTPKGKETPSSAGCWKDPDHPYSETTPTQNWGLTVKGGCPKDCLALEMALKGRNSNPKDPLLDTPGFTWGIYFADGSGNTLSPIRVFQIRVNNAVHGSAVLQSLRKGGIAKLAGYKGEILIGFTPAELNVE